MSGWLINPSPMRPTVGAQIPCVRFRFIFERVSAPYVLTCRNGNLDDNESKPCKYNRRRYSRCQTKPGLLDNGTFLPSKQMSLLKVKVFLWSGGPVSKSQPGRLPNKFLIMLLQFLVQDPASSGAGSWPHNLYSIRFGIIFPSASASKASLSG